MLLNFTFDQETAISALLYVVRNVPKPTYHKVAKIMYFADVMHLERFGRTIFGAEYRAYEFGPVPHQWYGFWKAAEKKPETHAFKDFFTVSRSKYPLLEAIAEPDLDQLSQSDLECLKASIEKWGNESFGKTTSVSHDTAWETAWAKKHNSVMEIETIVMTLPNGIQLLEHLQNPNP
jgi:uncharacterized phage-associated protein